VIWYREPWVVVVPLPNGPGRHVPEWGMPPGVYGCSTAGERWWTLILVDRKTGRWRGSGWLYPSEAMAQAGAKRERRRNRRHALRVNAPRRPTRPAPSY
jgi:hypothetical protein